MRVFRGLPDPMLRRPSAVAIGNFDGVHLGHQSLLHSVCTAASERGLVPSVVTFEPHPRDFFRKEYDIARISTLYDKVMRILDTGIERVYILPFHSSFAKQSARSFVKNVLCDGLDMRWITVGKDFRFGAGRLGTADLLQSLAVEENFEVFLAPAYLHHGERVSSTRIRKAMQKGDLYEVSLMLGHSYTMTGRVIHGHKLARRLGFPTLNIAPMPPGAHTQPAINGVFAVRIHGLGYAPLNGVASIGRKPTVSSDGRWLLETHVFDWQGNAYGHIIRVEFIERLRDEMKFSGLDTLKSAIQNDAISARRILGYSSVEIESSISV